MDRKTPQALPVKNASESLALTAESLNRYNFLNSNQSSSVPSKLSSITHSFVDDENCVSNPDIEKAAPLSPHFDVNQCDVLFGEDDDLEDLNFEEIQTMRSNAPYSPQFFDNAFPKDFTHSLENQNTHDTEEMVDCGCTLGFGLFPWLYR